MATKILITGGAGYIGAVLVPELLKEGYKVIVIDNFMYNQSSLLDCCYNKNLLIVRGDARDTDLISKWIRDVDFILPLACITGAPACEKDKVAAKTVNLEAVKLILRSRKKNQGIIFPNTNSGYGIGQKDIYCDENTPLRPISYYGKLKVQAEKEVMRSRNSISLRFATCFGTSPRMRLDLLVNEFVYRAVTEKCIVLFESHFKRNYLHVRDAARAFIHCLKNFEKMKNEVYNVGLSDANLSKLELCQEIKKQIPDLVIIESEIGQDPDKRNYIVSNAKIEKTGFKPKFSLQYGIKELIKCFQIIRKNQFSNV